MENSGGEKMVISEEEARRLLAEDKARLEQGWEKSEKRRKRIIKIAVTVAIVVVVIRLIFALIVRSK